MTEKTGGRVFRGQ